AFAGLMLFATTAAQANVAITVDKNAQIMTVAVDGVERYHWPVSTGIPSYETPNGSFRTFRMEEDHFSKEFDDAPMPHSIFFTKIGHAIHGTDSESRLNTTVTLTGSSQIALARNPRRNTAVARAQPYDQQYQQDQQYGAVGEPVQLTPQPQLLPGRRTAPQVQTDDGYIYPADGSVTDQRYPAPRQRLYDAQANPQQQYYNNNPGYAPLPAPTQGYYQQQQSTYYQLRVLID